MKTRISVTIDEELDKKIDKILKDSIYRNKSHFVEVLIKEAIKKEEIRKWKERVIGRMRWKIKKAK